MKIKDIMTPETHVTTPDATVHDAAEIMSENEVGMLPVHQDDKLIGVITDRDIVRNVVAKGLNCDQPVQSAMTQDLLYCREGDDAAEVARNMADNSVRRLPVVNEDKRLVGMVSLADIAQKSDATAAGRALGDIAREDSRKAA